MKFFATTFAVASAITAAIAQSPIIQSPPSLVQCQPALVSWSGGTAPYYISVLPGGQSSAAALVSFPTQNGNSYTWTVNIPAGQEITFSIRDSTGAVNYSSQVQIQESSDSSCLNGSSSASGSAGGASSAASSSSAPASSSSSASSSRSSSSSSASSSAASSAAMTSAPSSSAAPSSTSNTAAPASTSPGGAANSNYAANIAAVAGVAGLVAMLA